LALGPALFAVLALAPAPQSLHEPAWATAAVAAWMVVWWATEAVPLAATALLPLALLPALGVADVADAATPFANPLIFLFLGGFLIALAMQRWELHRRLALAIVVRAGVGPKRLIAGVMLATAALSMWISNTATAMMMLPIGLSLVAAVKDRPDPPGDADHANFATCMMLGIAYAASIGGLGTLIGSPPNALLASFMSQEFGIRVGFADWMLFGVPVVLVLLPIAWLTLTRITFPVSDRGDAEAAAAVGRSLAALGPLSGPEKRVAAVAGVVALAWITSPLLQSVWAAYPSDTGIAIIGAVILFAVPADWERREFLLDWDSARRAPWDILLLFGGGLSLARAIDKTGLAAWIGGGLEAIAAYPAIVVAGGVCVLVIFLTELTSNTATTAAILPVVGALSIAAGLDPLVLAVPAAMAASCAFMLPVATPPNAIVYGSGHVTVLQMMRAGILLNVAGTVIITLVATSLVPLLYKP
jgi:sodium-dependent dicarboxylate transporter 2/3/5